LIEQSIGRGLRLPYVKRTGVIAVDKLNIVAHDRFQEIIDEANNPENPLRMQLVILDAPSDAEKTESVTVGSNLDGLINGKTVGMVYQPLDNNLLIPHDEVKENFQLGDYVRKFERCNGIDHFF
jgi:hypothetical protein